MKNETLEVLVDIEDLRQVNGGDGELVGPVLPSPTLPNFGGLIGGPRIPDLSGVQYSTVMCPW